MSGKLLMICPQRTTVQPDIILSIEEQIGKFERQPKAHVP